MTSANVFDLNSVKQSQGLNANAATGKQKAENPEAGYVFASLMNENYSTNLAFTNAKSNTSSVNADRTEVGTAGNDYERYQYRDNGIGQAQDATVADKISDFSEELESFEEEVIQVVAGELGVSEDTVKEALESLGLIVFDVLNSQNLAQLATQLTGENSPAELLLNPQFLELMQSVEQMGTQLLDNLGLAQGQMDELIAQMDILKEPQPLDQIDFADLLDETAAAANVEAGAEMVVEAEAAVSAETVNEQLQPAERQQADLEPEAAETESPEKMQQSANENLQAQKTAGQQEENAGDAKADTRSFTSAPKETKAAEPSEGISFVTNEMVNQDVAELPEADTSYLSIDTMDLIEQIAENVRVSISEGTSSMEMLLNPENLGKVYLQVSSKEGVINAHIAASNEAVKAALEAQVAELRQTLNQSGVKVDAIEVTVASHEFEKNLEQNQNQEQKQGERQQEQLSHRRNLNLSSLDELSGVMTEEEALVAQIMRDNGNSVDLTA